MSETQDVAQAAEQDAQEIANQNQEVDSPEAAQDKAATDESGTEADSQEKDTQADERKFTQSELDDIIKKRIAKATAIAERKAAKAYAERLEALATQPKEQRQEAKAEGKPKLEDFEKVEDYVEAVADWKLQTHQQKQAQQAEEQRASNFRKQIEVNSERAYELASENPEFDSEEFDEVISRYSIDGGVALAIIESDVSAKLMLHMQKNPEDVARIAKLSPARQAAEIGKLEVKLSAPKEVKVSKAPAPVKPVGSRGSTSTRSPGEMSQSDFENWLYKNTKR